MKSERLVDKIHSTSTRAVIIATGGGTDIFPMLTRRGGGSATLISGMIPYHQTESIRLIGGHPDKLVSEETVRAMAMSAWQRAYGVVGNIHSCIGVATSSILQKTPEEREGREHIIYAALQTISKSVLLKLSIPKFDTGFFSWRFTPTHIRLKEEQLNALMILNLIAEGCGIEDRVQLPYGADYYVERTASVIRNGYLPNLLRNETQRITFDVSQFEVVPYPVYGGSATPGSVIFPGSFNPCHEAHARMRVIAEATLKNRCEFEICMENVDKPKMDLISLEERLGSIRRVALRGRVHITNASTFVEKSKLFHHSTFVIGYDTAARIHMSQYAGDIEKVMDVFEENKVKFLVFGRKMDDNFFCTLSGFHPRFQAISTLVPESQFREDVSSTEVRSATQVGS